MNDSDDHICSETWNCIGRISPHFPDVYATRSSLSDRGGSELARCNLNYKSALLVVVWIGLWRIILSDFFGDFTGNFISCEFIKLLFYTFRRFRNVWLILLPIWVASVWLRWGIVAFISPKIVSATVKASRSGKHGTVRGWVFLTCPRAPCRITPPRRPRVRPGRCAKPSQNYATGQEKL